KLQQTVVTGKAIFFKIIVRENRCDGSTESWIECLRAGTGGGVAYRKWQHERLLRCGPHRQNTACRENDSNQVRRIIVGPDRDVVCDEGCFGQIKELGIKLWNRGKRESVQERRQFSDKKLILLAAWECHSYKTACIFGNCQLRSARRLL